MKGTVRHLRRSLALLASLALLVAPPAAAEDPPPPPPAPEGAEGSRALPPEAAPPGFEQVALKVVDVFPVRVLSACAALIGLGAFVISVPLVAPAGRMDAIRESWDYFVMGPVDYTFVRPLGEL